MAEGRSGWDKTLQGGLEEELGHDMKAWKKSLILYCI